MSVPDSNRDFYQLCRYILCWGIVITRFNVDPVAGVCDIHGEANADIPAERA